MPATAPEDVDLENGVLHLAHNYVVVGGQRVRKDTKTHQDRYLAIDRLRARCSASIWTPSALSLAGWGLSCPRMRTAAVRLNIKGLRHYTASQLLAARFDLRNTAARLGHGSGGATTLRHYADPISEVDRQAAAYLAQLTAGSADEKSSEDIIDTGRLAEQFRLRLVEFFRRQSTPDEIPGHTGVRSRPVYPQPL